jgi:stage II sporulation protein D
MYMRLLLLVLTLLPFSTSVHAGVWDNIVNTVTGGNKPKAPSIRVLIVHDADRATLEVKGKYSLFDPYTNSFISTRFAGKRRDLETLSDGIKWGEAFPGVYQLKIRPDDRATALFVDDKEYKGNLFIYDIGGSLSIVNQTPIEEYITSILADYDQYNLHPEALASVAIAARTNAYYQANNPKNTYWAVDAKKVGFTGLGNVSPEINEAVRVTRYMIMSRTGIYEGVATPFASQFNTKTIPSTKDAEVAKISLEEVNKMAQNGEHAAQILSKAFPNTQIMMLEYAN